MALQPGERKQCEACGMPMIGARTRKGSVAPVVLAPSDDGNALLYRQPDGTVEVAVLGRADVRTYIAALGVPLRVVHFADCPAADQFRRRHDNDPEGGRSGDDHGTTAASRGAAARE
jgi:hypothetical protein